MNRPATFHELLRAAGLAIPAGLADVRIGGLKVDSRTVERGDVFLSLRGTRLDGTAFVEDAVRRGAAALLVDGAVDAQGHSPFPSVHGAEVPSLSIPSLRSHVGALYDAWNGYPSRALEFHGVTGTNGKSTTVLLMSGILRAAGRHVVSLGTIRYQIGHEILDATLTTPSTADFYGMLARGVAQGCDTVAMEVSSHALSQDRVRGVRFSRALFTNLTQDHLDFHADFEEYFAAKKRLFTEYLRPDGVGIINLDSPYGVRLLQEWTGAHVTFSRGEAAETRQADLVLREARLSLERTELTVEHQGRTFIITSRLVGAINIENLLGAAAFGLSLGLSPEMVAKGIEDVVVPGRNEVIRLPNRSFAVVDYAHTPDALERVLGSLRSLTSGRLHVVFGCGGDRDRGKRPLMGRIAERLADRVILTSDNPRGEEPEDILNDIRAGMDSPEAAVVLTDRRAAIRNGLEHLGTGDCLLVAGKGHEDYQILGGKTVHFSDQEEIAAWAAGRTSAGAGDTWS
jgi:UDP-N-acetylmuramoyl-L-alanyl-D-glutamate--2,6-diaminopimelate ligase